MALSERKKEEKEASNKPAIRVIEVTAKRLKIGTAHDIGSRKTNEDFGLLSYVPGLDKLKEEKEEEKEEEKKVEEKSCKNVLIGALARTQENHGKDEVGSTAIVLTAWRRKDSQDSKKETVTLTSASIGDSRGIAIVLDAENNVKEAFRINKKLHSVTCDEEEYGLQEYEALESKKRQFSEEATLFARDGLTEMTGSIGDNRFPNLITHNPYTASYQLKVDPKDKVIIIAASDGLTDGFHHKRKSLRFTDGVETTEDKDYFSLLPMPKEAEELIPNRIYVEVDKELNLTCTIKIKAGTIKTTYTLKKCKNWLWGAPDKTAQDLENTLREIQQGKKEVSELNPWYSRIKEIFFDQKCYGFKEKTISFREDDINGIANTVAEGLKKGNDLSTIGCSLITKAREKGSTDNTTAILLEIQSGKPPALVAVFDGHKGDSVAKEASENFFSYIKEALLKWYQGNDLVSMSGEPEKDWTDEFREKYKADFDRTCTCWAKKNIEYDTASWAEILAHANNYWFFKRRTTRILENMEIDLKTGERFLKKKG